MIRKVFQCAPFSRLPRGQASGFLCDEMPALVEKPGIGLPGSCRLTLEEQAGQQ